MSHSFPLTYVTTEPVVEEVYGPEPINTVVPHKMGLESLGFTLASYNITKKKKRIISLYHWRYTTADKLNIYYADKTDDSMKYEHQVYILPIGNYEFDDIIDVLSKQKLFKDTRMEIKLDKISFRCMIKCDWVASILGFENRLLKPGKTHISDHMPEIFSTYFLKIHCSLINTNIENVEIRM